MPTLRQQAATAAVRLLRAEPLRRAALRVAAARHRRLVLVYHRIGPGGPASHEVVPTMPLDVFRRQVAALQLLGSVEPLHALARPSQPSPQPRFAITFDDDYSTHVDHVLPALKELGVPATFFLSGRSLHGLGPYWWERLEEAIRQQGLRAMTKRLGLSAQTPAALASSCEGTPRASELESLPPDGVSAPIDMAGIRRLAEAGMSIGFHSVQHPLMPSLEPDEIEGHLTDGRGRLEEVIGAKILSFAYPHGKAGLREARQAEAAGYESAFTGSGRPVGKRSNPYLLGRWEPNPHGEADFASAIGMRLNLPARR